MQNLRTLRNSDFALKEKSTSQQRPVLFFIYKKSPKSRGQINGGETGI